MLILNKLNIYPFVCIRKIDKEFLEQAREKSGRTVFYGAERREAEANSPWDI
jgi:hypothetical protein